MTARWPCAHHVAHLGEMLGAALGHRIRELGQPMPARQMHVLDLDVAQALVGASSSRSMRLFRPYFTSRRRPDSRRGALMRRAAMASATSLLGWPVLMPTSDGALAEVGLHQLPGEAILAGGAVALGEPDDRAGRGEAQHRAGVGAGGGDEPPVVQAHVGQEPLVALDQRAAQRGGEAAWARKVGRLASAVQAAMLPAPPTASSSATVDGEPQPTRAGCRRPVTSRHAQHDGEPRRAPSRPMCAAGRCGRAARVDPTTTGWRRRACGSTPRCSMRGWGCCGGASSPR